MLKLAIEIIGWAGAVTMLVAYMLLTTGRLAADSALYQWLNVLASVGLVLNGAWNGAYPSVFLNVVWMGIGLYGLSHAVRRRAA